MTVPLVLESNGIYKIAAVAMIVVGSAMIAVLIAVEFSPHGLPGCNIDLPSYPNCSHVQINEPSIDDYLPSYSNFIFLASGVSLVAFGGSILGIVLRLGK